MRSVSVAEARRIAVRAQLLDGSATDVRSTVRALGSLQLDPIATVAPAQALGSPRISRCIGDPWNVNVAQQVQVNVLARSFSGKIQDILRTTAIVMMRKDRRRNRVCVHKEQLVGRSAIRLMLPKVSSGDHFHIVESAMTIAKILARATPAASSC